MHSKLLALLFLPLLVAGPPAPLAAPPVGRVRNRASQAWTLAMGQWVAGKIRILSVPDGGELAQLKPQGPGFVLDPGRAVDLEATPDANGLALQVTIVPVARQQAGASVYISQGLPGDRPTLNPNESPAVRVDKTLFGRPKDGEFVVIQ